MLDLHLALSRFAAHLGADGDVERETALPAPHHQARQADVRQTDAQARRPVAAQLRLTGWRVEKRHVPAMRQRVAFAQGHGVAVQHRSQAAHQRQCADVMGLLRTLLRGIS